MLWLIYAYFQKLTRHGARTPTESSTLAIVNALSKLKSVTKTYKHPKLDFLKNFDIYDELSLSDGREFKSGMLIPYGAAELVLL